MSVDEPTSVTTYRALIEHFLNNLYQPSKDTASDRPISDTDCQSLLEQIKEEHEQRITNPGDGPSSNHAVIETVFRDIFVALVAATPTEETAFAQVWNLLDVVNVLSDQELCEPSLGFWLVEELLDSQTIAGCRRVFDFLESRRERMTARHFQNKKLAVLRCCNELLRRLSRAEDTVFCGRVFIFMFQSFPLGDRSSVNLRGEFHVENVTTFDPAPQRSEDAIQPMEIDSGPTQTHLSGSMTPSSTAEADRSVTGRNTPAQSKMSKAEEPVDLDALYPRFWGLQSVFSNPTKLFDPVQMGIWKEGLAATLSCFQKVTHSQAPSTRPDDVKRGIKRKRSETAHGTSNFNPKYLTNRDLFDLEVHDIAFRRHILVQALIMIDFLLSLTAPAKQKLTGLSNQSVLYSYTLSPEDTKWATSTKHAIAEYLQSSGPGNEGKAYHRMVDTVLSRDRNWVRWKAENCPSISRDPVLVVTQLEAQRTLSKLSKQQPLTPVPGAADLDFLSKTKSLQDLSHASGRHSIPTTEEFYQGIQNDQLDAEMGTDEEMAEAKERAQAKLWRALRSSGRRFHLCEKIDNGRNLKALVAEDGDESEGKEDKHDGAGSPSQEKEIGKQSGRGSHPDRDATSNQGDDHGTNATPDTPKNGDTMETDADQVTDTNMEAPDRPSVPVET